MTPAATDALYQYSFVADAGTARAMAHALMTWRRVARLWFVFVILATVGTALFYASTDPTSGELDRLVAAAGRSLMLVLPICALLLGAMYCMNRRTLRRRVPEGAVWQSGFEERDFVVNGPLASYRYSYDLVRSVGRSGEFVFLQLHGRAATLGYSRALFPEHELARLEHRIPQPGSRAMVCTAIVLAVCAVMLGYVVALDPVNRGAPEYGNAAAIVEALHAHGIQCSYQPVDGGPELLATSAGECTGDDFVLYISVYATEPLRQDRQAQFDRYWCEHDELSGTWVTGPRWLVGVAHRSGATSADPPDLLGATGGNSESPQCDARA